MTSTAFDDQYTTAPEPVRQPYDTASILRRNVADLELALRTQTELKEKAEAELAQARQQKPLTWGTSGELMDILKNPIYSSPAPVPAPAVPELDPMTRLIVSDPKQIKPKKQEPAVPSVVFMAYNKTSSILFAARKDADQYAASFGPAAGVSVTECAVIGSQSAPQAPAVPEQKPIWSGWSVWFKGGDGLFPAHFLHDSYGIPLRYPTRFAAAEKIKRHTRDSRELYEPREYSLYDAPQAPAVPEFCAVEAQLTLAEIIRNARRYLALRENEVIIMQAADPDFDAEGYRARYDAAADRLLEGGV